mmetsp:Transcript_6446/g.14791  ORF Transcript_6446/g.14791 Transcript_6446/m.14791 type:complete len:122 (+) Transcript_6446:75-440(+)
MRLSNCYDKPLALKNINSPLPVTNCMGVLMLLPTLYSVIHSQDINGSKDIFANFGPNFHLQKLDESFFNALHFYISDCITRGVATEISTLRVTVQQLMPKPKKGGYNYSCSCGIIFDNCLY